MKARIENGIVVEFLEAIPGFSIEQCFHPIILAQCIDFEEGMQVGAAWPPELAPEEPVPAPEPAPE